MSKHFLAPLVGATICLVLINQDQARAMTAIQVGQIAKQSTVRIESANSPGSGVIIQKKNNVYTVLTSAHVVRNSESIYKIMLADGQEQVAQNIRIFSNKIDLAVIEFTSTKKYPVPKLVKDANKMFEGSTVYVSGFPTTEIINQAIFNFTEGKLTANSSKPLNNGYSLVYSNNTLPGHSGGPVWNDEGEIIAIHGKGDVDARLSNSAINPNVRVKTGFNLGISVNTFTQQAAALGLEDFKPFVEVIDKSTPVDDLLLSGLEKISRSSYQPALADLEKAIQANPKRAVAYLYRGTARSLATTQKAFNDKTAVAKARRVAANSSQLDFAVSLKRSFLADYQIALADFTQAFRLNPKSIWALEAAANIYNDLGEYNQAIQLLDRSIQMKPTDNAYGLRGFAKQRTANLPGALDDYTTAMMLVPLSPFYCGMRAGVYEDQGNYRKAIQDYDQAIRLQPDDATTYYFGRGLAKLKLGDRQGAIADLDAANRVDQNFIDAYLSKGVIYLDAQQGKLALLNLNKALALVNKKPGKEYVRSIVLGYRGGAKYLLKDYVGALRDLDSAIAADQDLPQAFYYRGLVKAHQGRKVGAIKDLNLAAQLFLKYKNTDKYELTQLKLQQLQ